jgi:acylphosphatase
MPVTDPLTRLYFVVKGRVQGVGFRWFTQSSALQLGITGWVRNLPNGDVEGEAEGSAPALARLRKLLEAGPSHAEVDGVECKALPPQGSKTFEIR